VFGLLGLRLGLWGQDWASAAATAFVVFGALWLLLLAISVLDLMKRISKWVVVLDVLVLVLVLVLLWEWVVKF
jgi:hypothetical protein